MTLYREEDLDDEEDEDRVHEATEDLRDEDEAEELDFSEGRRRWSTLADPDE